MDEEGAPHFHERVEHCARESRVPAAFFGSRNDIGLPSCSAQTQEGAAGDVA